MLVSAVLLLIVFFGLAEVYSRGRRQLGYEEERRKATAVGQARMDGIRRDFGYDELPDLDGDETSMLVEGKQYVIAHEVIPGTPEDQSTTIVLTVKWTAKVGGQQVSRSHTVTSIIGREMPWAD